MFTRLQRKELEVETQIQKVGSVTIVKVSGVVDSETVDDFGSALASLVEKGEFQILLDIEDLSYINTAGLSVIADVFKKARQNQGSLKIMNAPEAIKELLEIVRFTRIIDLFENEDAALDSFGEAGR